MLFFICVLIFSTAINALDKIRDDELVLSLNGLNKTLTYLSQHVVTDADVRMKSHIAMGQLKSLLSRMTTRYHVNEDQRKFLEEIVTTIERINNKTEDNEMIGKYNWEISYPSKMTDPSFSYKWQDKDVLSDKISSYCLDQARGTNNFAGRPCSQTDYCWKYMTAANKPPAYLKAELLYLLLGENFGCQLKMTELAEKHGQESYQILYDRLCSTLQPTSLQNIGASEWDGDVYDYMLYCGILGYEDFFISSTKRVSYWLSVQMDDGCISDAVQMSFSVFNLQSVLKYLGISQGRCLVERTAMVAALWVEVIRFLIEDPELTN